MLDPCKVVISCVKDCVTLVHECCSMVIILLTQYCYHVSDFDTNKVRKFIEGSQLFRMFVAL